MISSSAILVDTCIINNLLSKETDLAETTAKLLNGFIKNGNTLAISVYTRYELLRSISDANATKCIDILNKFVIIRDSEARLKRATKLYSLYKKDGAVSRTMNSISDIDVFLGSLIFTDHQPYLLTADYHDFPRPFFLEKEYWNIEFKKKRGGKCSIYYYLLQANLETFDEK